MASYPKYGREHCLFVEVKETASLKDLDSFLRDIWLECCGHLSGFEIEGISYEAETGCDYTWQEVSKSMNCKLMSVLRKGLTFDYEYDFGSTTGLMITVVNYRVRGLPKYGQVSFYAEICRWTEAGKIVMMATQVTHEGSEMEVYRMGRVIKEDFHLMEAYDMTLEAMVTKVMWFCDRQGEHVLSGQAACFTRQ